MWEKTTILEIGLMCVFLFFGCNYFTKVVSGNSCFFLCVFLTYELLHGARETKK